MPFYFIKNQQIGPVFPAPQPAREAQLIADGYVLVEDTEEYSRGTHMYIDGAFVEIPAADLLAAAKEAAQGELLATVNRFIEAKPDGKARYDTNLKLNLLQAAMAAMAQGQSSPAPVVSVETWFAAVQQVYLYDRKQALADAADLTALEAVDISYEWFEARYGLTGTVLADPDVYTSDIAGAGQ